MGWEEREKLDADNAFKKFVCDVKVKWAIHEGLIALRRAF